MTASPDMIAIFNDWQRAYLVAHYAAPCADELMNTLVEASHERQIALAEHPSANADDLFLKLFPIIIAEFEPARGDAPLMPNFAGGGRLLGERNDSMFSSIIADLLHLSPRIAAAAAAPHAIPGGEPVS